jgi:predicted restriction endonuclease
MSQANLTYDILSFHCTSLDDQNEESIDEVSFKTYRAKQPYWAIAVKMNAASKCEICGCKESKLIAHHKIPYSDCYFYRYDTNNGICLCKSHHDAVERVMKKWKSYPYGSFGLLEACIACNEDFEALRDALPDIFF